MNTKLTTTIGLALAAGVCLAGPATRNTARHTKGLVGTSIIYQELDHFHGGYEVNVGIGGDGSFELFAVNSNGTFPLINATHMDGTTPASKVAPWARWFPVNEPTDFYVALFDTLGNMTALVHLPLAFDSNPFPPSGGS
jgi:hypothetical protein